MQDEEYTNQEIVNTLYKDDVVEMIARNIRVSKDFFNDFCQDIYLTLLEYDNEKLNEIYKKGQLRFFTARICTNNWNSRTSPFYTKYKKPLAHENKNVDLTRLSEKI